MQPVPQQMKSKIDQNYQTPNGKTASTISYWQFAIDSPYLNLSIVLLFSFIMFFYSCASRTVTQNHHLLQSESDSTLCVIDTKYPVWFFNPPIGAVTGYYHDTVSAITDAKIRMAGYKKMIVYGTSRYYEDGRWDDMQDSISFYFNENDTNYSSSLQTIDSFFTCCTGYLHLYGNKEILIDTSRVDACGFSNGTQPPKGSQRLYATGEARFEYYNQPICWMRAEEEAVKELCNQAIFRFSSLTKKNDSEFATTIQKKFELLVKNVRVDKRVFNNEHRICQVLISCPSSDITPLPKETNNE